MTIKLAHSADELDLAELSVTTLVSMANDLSKAIDETARQEKHYAYSLDCTKTDAVFTVITNEIVSRQGRKWMTSHVTCPRF